MFGIGGSEILVILIVALLFLGPDKLPEAAKTISKHIRDLKKQSRILQETIENEPHIGGALRDIKSALRGDELPSRPPVRSLPTPGATPEPVIAGPPPTQTELPFTDAAAVPAPELPAPAPKISLSPTAGEADTAETHSAEDLAALIKRPSGTVTARETTTTEPATEPAPAAEPASKLKHG